MQKRCELNGLSLVFVLAVSLSIFSAAPLGAATINVAPGGDLPGAMAAANCGDTIVLQSDATYTTPYNVPLIFHNPGTCTGTDADYITIQSSNMAGLPPAGTRVNPAIHAAAMARIVVKNIYWQTAPYAHHWKLVGLEITSAGDDATFTPVLLGLGINGSAAGGYPTYAELHGTHDFIVDRCFLHPAEIDAQHLSTTNTRRTAGKGIIFDVVNATVKDSYIAGFAGFNPSSGEMIDSMGVLSDVGPGPLTITNNYIEASYSNVFIGGADPATPNEASVVSGSPSQATLAKVTNLRVGDLVAFKSGGSFRTAKVTAISGNTVSYVGSGPTALNGAPDVPGLARWNGDPGPADVRISGNTLHKRPEWYPAFGQPKNWIEMKCGIHITVDGNVMTSPNYGTNLAITVRNQNGSSPWVRLEDVQISNNHISNWGSFVGLLTEDNERTSSLARNIRFINNLLDAPGASTYNYAFYLSGGFGTTRPDTILVQHNTFINSNVNNIFYGASGPITGMVFKDNIAYHGAYGLNCSSGAGACWPGLVDEKNVYINNSGDADGNIAALHPLSSVAHSVGNVGFTDAAGGNYRLSSGSVYRRAASDGTDVGVNIDTLNTALAGQGQQGGSTGNPTPAAPTNVRIH